MSTASSYVFVSYAHQDADAVDALVRALENRGISFRSDRDIGIGEGWKDRLGQWLNDAEAVLVVWSPHSAVSASVIGEATRARGRLVPVSLTGTPAVPRDFQDLQTLDLSLWTGDFSDPRLEQLAQILQVRATTPAIQGTADERGGAAAKEQRPGVGDGPASRPHANDQQKPWYRRMPAWVGPTVVGPVIVGVILAFVTGWVPRIIGAGSSTVSQQPTPSQSTSPHSSATGSPKPSNSQVTTAPVATPPVIVAQDNFCSKKDDWNNAAAYSNCALLIRTKANQIHGDIESSEPGGSNFLYPQAPPSITVEVVAQMIAGSSQGDPQLGVSCRASPDLNDPNGYGYAFIVGQDLVEVIKYSNNTGQVGSALAEEPVTLDLTQSNTLMATCESFNAGTAVKLALRVNGRPLLNVTEDSPVANGTVGLFAATTGYSPISDVVQFKSFEVTRL